MGDGPRGRHAQRVRPPDEHRRGRIRPGGARERVRGRRRVAAAPRQGRVPVLLRHAQRGRRLRQEADRRAQEAGAR